jgi:AAA domain
VEAILAGFRVPCMATGKPRRLQALLDMLFDVQRRSGAAVLAIDEAQLLTPELFDEIRMLRSLHPGLADLLQIVLCGQPEMEEKLSGSSLSRLQSSITVRCNTAPLTLQDTRDYIRHRLKIAGAKSESIFTGEAADAVHLHSRGIPRVVNLLCGHGLANAGLRGIRPVTPQMIDEAAGKMLFTGLNPPRRGLRGPLSGNGRSAQPPASPSAPSAGESRNGSSPPQATNHAAVPRIMRLQFPNAAKFLAWAMTAANRVSPIRPSISIGAWGQRLHRWWSANFAQKKYWMLLCNMALAGTLLLVLAQAAVSPPPRQRAARTTCGFVGLLLLDVSLGLAAYLFFYERRARLAGNRLRTSELAFVHDELATPAHGALPGPLRTS